MSNLEEKKFLNHFSIRLFNLRKSPSTAIPDKKEVERFTKKILALLFPHFSVNKFTDINEIESELIILEKELCHIISPLEEDLDKKAHELAKEFFTYIPVIHDLLLMDAEAIAKNDPAAKNIDEVILTYPGFFAIAIYRMAHKFDELKIPYFPRVMTEYAHKKTGIDIHPSAVIGKSFCIDHGTGIVIGETTHIGDHVKLYQGVTLGALSVSKKMANVKRHPTIEDNTVIYSNATILGGETIIGKNSIIGGNVWLTESVPDNSIVYHSSEIKLKQNQNS